MDKELGPQTTTIWVYNNLQNLQKSAKSANSSNPPNDPKSKLAAARMKQLFKNVNGSVPRGDSDKK